MRYSQQQQHITDAKISTDCTTTDTTAAGYTTNTILPTDLLLSRTIISNSTTSSTRTPTKSSGTSATGIPCHHRRLNCFLHRGSRGQHRPRQLLVSGLQQTPQQQNAYRQQLQQHPQQQHLQQPHLRCSVAPYKSHTRKSAEPPVSAKSVLAPANPLVLSSAQLIVEHNFNKLLTDFCCVLSTCCYLLLLLRALASVLIFGRLGGMLLCTNSYT
eukprot:Lankesteria_metandrocarpae@DN7414_c0_g1_i1.p1